MSTDAKTPRCQDARGLRWVSVAVGLGLAVLALPREAAAQSVQAVRVGASTGGGTVRAAPGRIEVKQEPAPRRGVSAGEVVGGIVGSAAGMWGGLLVVYGAGARCGSDCADDSFGAGVVGIVVGSIAGTALGTHLGAKMAHRPPGGFGRRLLGAGVGFLAGLGAFALTDHDDDNILPLIALPVAQGVVGAWLGRAR